MIVAVAASGFLVLSTVMIHYEGLKYLWLWTAFVTFGRRRILVAVLGIFIIHLFEIFLYALAFWFFDIVVDIGSFGGQREQVLFDYFYLSAETFTTVGFGDIYPSYARKLVTA